MDLPITVKTSKVFLDQYIISHKVGIPYNSQGQAIVERSHAKIKNYLKKIKGNDILGPFGTPYAKLPYILYILNFLLVDKEGKSASDRHWRHSERTNYGFVKWKDFQSGSWKGPDPVLLRLRGSVCFSERCRWTHLDF